MKIRKKIRLGILLASIVSVLSSPIVTMAESSLPDNNTNCREGITLYGDIYEWRYKIIDGILYRRLFNCTTQTWVGDWEKA